MSSASDDSLENRLIQVDKQLQIPTDTLQITQVRLDQLKNKSEVDESNLDDVAAAALALSCREDGLPVTEQDIAEAWSATLDDEDVSLSHQQIDAVGSYLNIDDVPSHPDALIKSFAEEAGMESELVPIAQRFLDDLFDMDPTVVASGPSPAATAGAVLYLAALANGRDDTYGQDDLGRASGTNVVAVRNRVRDFQDLLGEEEADADRYKVEKADTSESADTEESETAETAEPESVETAEPESAETQEPEQTESAEPETTEETATAGSGDASDGQSTAADGAGRSEADAGSDDEDWSTGTDTDSGGDDWDGSGSDLAVEAVESEVDELVDEIDVGASTRLMARGMIGDAVDAPDFDDAAALAGTTIVAASRMEGAEPDAIDVAEVRDFEPRVVSQHLDTLDEAVDVDIPRRSTDEVIEQIVDQLGLSESIHEESLISLERYEPDEVDVDYTTAELSAGAVMFAATIGRTDIDIEELSELTGASPDFITKAMNSIVVSLCLGLVRGDIDYEEFSWTTDLLESELSPDIGDSYTGRAIAIAKTYAAGREGRNIDESTLNAVLADE